MNKVKAIARLKVEHDFLCSKKIEDVNKWGCKDCQYYYERSEFNTPRCLKKEVEDWTLYRIEVAHE